MFPNMAPWSAQARLARVREMRPHAPGDLRLLLALLSVAAALWSFLLVAGAVDAGSTQAFDQRVVELFRDPAQRHLPISAGLEDVARDVTALGSIPLIVLVTVAVAGFLALARLRRALVLLLAAVLGGSAWTFLLKELFDRARPAFVDGAPPVDTSFPSGHSALSAVVYLTLASLLARLMERRDLRAYVIAVAALVTFLVGASRVILGMHWPSDVLAGWTLGLAWALFCWTATTALQRRGRVETPEEAHRRW
jgi:undecaprenyl-diphosphatase